MTIDPRGSNTRLDVNLIPKRYKAGNIKSLQTISHITFGTRKDCVNPKRPLLSLQLTYVVHWFELAFDFVFDTCMKVHHVNKLRN